MQAIERSNVNLPTGKLIRREAGLHGAIERRIDARRRLPAADRRLQERRADPAGATRQRDRRRRKRQAVAWFKGVRGMILAVQRQPGTNTVEVVDNIKALLPQFRAEIPPAVKLNIAFDASESIRGSIHDVEFTLVLTVCLVVMVIFMFLRNLTATLIPGVAVPLSIIGTFAAMYLLGYSLNNLSLMALTLSVGFVVDDAIVMLENIVRYMEMGKGAWRRRCWPPRKSASPSFP